MPNRKIILFELNEVPFRIIDEYCAKHPDSFLAKNLGRCHQYLTRTEDKGHLSPWITWPTLHRGVNNEKHLIHDFNQDFSHADKNYPSIWRILTDHGVDTGVFASLHSYPLPQNLKNYSFYVPDPFAHDSRCHPDDLTAFQDFNLMMSRDSARNVSSQIHWKPALKVLVKSPKLGLRLSTYAELARQVVIERLKPSVKVRRRTYQSVLAFDIFLKSLSDRKPAFATFFTNHVASSMHRYWAASFPQDYAAYKITDEWKETYRDEIDFSMGKFNEFFERLIGFVDANPEYVLIVASSMGQAATEARTVQSQLAVSQREVFLRKMGLKPGEWEVIPGMFPQFNLTVAATRRDEFRAALKSLVINGQSLSFREDANGFFSLDFGQEDLTIDAAEFQGRMTPFSDLGLTNMKIDDASTSTSYHVPEGSMLVYDPKKSATSTRREEISTVHVAPSILKALDVPVPTYMTYRPLAGVNG